MTFSPDGKLLVTGAFQEIAIWDVNTGVLKQKIPGFAHEVVAPHLLDESVATQDLAAALHQHAQQLVLLGREIDRRAAG